ncbi:MAG: hypothetical protein O2807_06155 [bacterium]|nr:hypothetical protein [bacterium]
MALLDELKRRREQIQKELRMLSQLLLHRASLEAELQATDLLIERTVVREREGKNLKIPEKFKLNRTLESTPKELSSGVAQDVFEVLVKKEKPMRIVEIQKDVLQKNTGITRASIRQALKRNPDHFMEYQPRRWGLVQWLKED